MPGSGTSRNESPVRWPRRRSDDPAPDDLFRGLYVTDDTVDHLLRGPDPLRVQTRRPGFLGDGPLGGWPGPRVGCPTSRSISSCRARSGPRRRFERLYGYLNDDVTRRRATIGLALEFGSRRRPRPRAALSSSGTAGGAGPGARPGSRPAVPEPALRVPDRVTAHLLGDARPRAEVARCCRPSSPAPERPRRPPGGRRAGTVSASPAGAPARVGARHRPRDRGGSRRRASASRRWLDLSLLARARDPEEPVHLCGREALLREAGLVAGPVEALAGPQWTPCAGSRRAGPVRRRSAGPQPGSRAARASRCAAG